MYDRNVQFPQRYRMVKVEGTDDIYDLVPAPGEIGHEGTFINKATLLKDTTAALFGLNEAAVPDNVFKVLSRFHGGLGNEHIWKRTLETSEKIPAGYTLGEVQTDVVIYAQQYDSGRENYFYEDEVSVSDDGSVSLSETAGSAFGFGVSSATYYNWGILCGKFISPNGQTTLSGVNYIPEDATFSTKYVEGASTPYQVIVSKVQSVEGYAAIPAGTHVDYVNAPNANAYPPAEDDGYTYAYLGQLGGASHIATGSYTGTGTYGVDNPNSLTFDGVPQIVFLYTIKDLKHNNAVEGHYYTLVETLIPDFGYSTTGEISSTLGGWYITVERENNTMIWYSTKIGTTDYRSAANQFNSANTEYFYVAICG